MVNINLEGNLRVNIYELNENRFLFEFPNKHMAGRIISEQWRWKNLDFKLEWWSPTTGCIANSSMEKATWIRAVGVPVHLWTNKVFQEIKQACGGWVATEKWARIRVAKDGRLIPREVSITPSRRTYFIPIWVESKTRVELSTESTEETAGEVDADEYLVESITQRVITETHRHKVQKSHQTRDLAALQHVGVTGTTGKRDLGVSRGRHMFHLHEKKQSGQIHRPKSGITEKKGFGPDFAAQVIYNNLRGLVYKDKHNRVSR